MYSQVFVRHDGNPKCYPIPIQTEEIDGSTLKDLIRSSPENVASNVYILFNGRKLRDDDTIRNGQGVQMCNRIPGGKGGFGSMLRAIGAQIEKTTNREACRDLSGRRLRDIAEEMRLKKWIAKQADREQEKAARRREKLERRLTAPRHEFRDPNYDKQRSEIPEKVNDALMQGLAVSKSGSKRPGSETKSAPKKPKLWLGMQEDFADEASSEEMETSSDSSSSDDQKPGPSTAGKSTPSASTSRGSLPGTLEIPAELPEEAAEERPSDSAIPEASNSLTDSGNDVQTQEDARISEEAKTPQDTRAFDLNDFDSADQLESLGLDRLKAELAALGMKCGGTLRQRAERLFSVKGLSADRIKPSLLARPAGKPKN